MSNINIKNVSGSGHSFGDNNHVNNKFEALKENERSLLEKQIPSIMNKERSAQAPKVFISYAWDDETKIWVKEFASKLRNNGVDALIDQWVALPGDKLTHFMENAVRDNDYILIICTPKYKEKSDGRKGGVGYEGDIMTAEVFRKNNHRKYIPILKTGNNNTAIPTWLDGKLYIDLSSDVSYDDGYKSLVTTIFQVQETAPPLGQVPDFIQKGFIAERNEFSNAKLDVEDDLKHLKSLFKQTQNLSQYVQLQIELYIKLGHGNDMYMPGVTFVQGLKIMKETYPTNLSDDHYKLFTPELSKRQIDFYIEGLESQHKALQEISNTMRILVEQCN